MRPSDEIIAEMSQLMSETSFTPAMVDRALYQTWKVGLKYAAVPMPVWEDFCRWSIESGCRLDWATLCGYDDQPPDDEGNIYVCLLERDHDGEHGYAAFVGGAQ